MLNRHVLFFVIGPALWEVIESVLFAVALAFARLLADTGFRVWTTTWFFSDEDRTVHVQEVGFFQVGELSPHIALAILRLKGGACRQRLKSYHRFGI